MFKCLALSSFPLSSDARLTVVWHTDSLMLPISTAYIPSDRVELRKWKCSLLSTDTKYREYAKIMATAVHANVMMGRHPMAAVPPHAHTQPHAHQGAAPKPHNVMLQQPQVARTQLVSPLSNAPNSHSQGISTGN